MDVALKNYSSGMHMRLGFAIAAHLDPDIFLLDEVFAVGDEAFQAQCMATMNAFASEGRTIVFVSHSALAVRKMCRRVCVLDGGRLQFDGDVERGLDEYHKLLEETDPGAALRAAPAGPSETDLAVRARRHISGWALDLLRREGLTAEARTVEIGIEASPDPASPILGHVGASRYAYCQAGALAPGHLKAFDVGVAASVFVHFPLNVIARVVAGALHSLPPGGRLYATFYEVPAGRAFVPTPWPRGVVTSPDRVPYQYSFELLDGIVTALGARLHRVEGVTHPNGETTVVVVKGAPPRGV